MTGHDTTSFSFFAHASPCYAEEVSAENDGETPQDPDDAPPLLNEPQMAAAAHIDGPMVVFAGAGSGKTRVITYRIANLLATCNVPLQALGRHVLNKAAGEKAGSSASSAPTSYATSVGTFHLCSSCAATGAASSRAASSSTTTTTSAPS
jgi:hypothetical protein